MPQPTAGVQLYQGKAKTVTLNDAQTVNLFFKDDVTAFNAQKHRVIPGKGCINSRISEVLFIYLRSVGISNHYLKRIDPATLQCQRAEMLPLEVVVRFVTAGSLVKRTGLPPLSPCDPPVIEFYYKRDDLGDPIVNSDHIRLLNLASVEDVAHLSAQALKTAGALHRLCGRAGLNLIDIKFEYGRHNGALILADEISPDSCRLHDRKTGRILDKDLFRRDLGDLLDGYNEVLSRLQSALLEESP
jgi:phosphoribosylaminoimidazole-succinocarboxamide synthase